MAPPAAAADAAPQGTDHVVEETIRDLKKIHGFHGYVILNNDGIVIKYENMSYRTAVHYSHQVLGLASKASKYIRELFEAPDNEVESIRLRTLHHELIIAQHGYFTIIATHVKPKDEPEEVKVEGAEGEKKEGEAGTEEKK
jgi:dynein light chain roadblock-type